MTGKRRAALGGRWLDEMDERIICQGIETGSGSAQVSTVTRFGGSGSRVTNVHRASLPVTVKFSIRVKRGDLQARSEIYEAVMSWAGRALYGAWLTVNYKENRRIWVRLTEAPAEEDLWDWTKTYNIRFTAYGVPYWQEASGNSLRVANVSSNDRILLGVSGNTWTVLDASFENLSGSTVNNLRIQTGESLFQFSGLGLANRETLKISHTEEGLLTLQIIGTGGSTRSAMAKRTTASDNELRLEPGTERIRFQADGAGTLNLSSVGRFL